MALFNKKNCDVCGQKIGLLGNRKLEDGNLCKDCAKKLSPWFTGRRHSTLRDIKLQLSSREENMNKVRTFRSTMELGQGYKKIFIDQNAQNFAVCANSDFEKNNPDIIPISSVTAVKTRRDEHRNEEKYKDSEGNMVSYNPPRYEFSYDFYCTIDVEHPYIDEIEFKINDSSLKQGQGIFMNEFSRKMSECESICDEIKIALGRGQSAGMGFGNTSNQFNVQGSGMKGAAMAGLMNAMAGAGMNNGMNQMNGMNAGMGMNQANGMNTSMGMNQANGMNAGMGMNQMNSMNNGMGMQMGPAVQVDIPMMLVTYNSRYELGNMFVSMNVMGNASYRVIDQNTYSRTLLNGAGILGAELENPIRLAFSAMEQAGVEATMLPSQFNTLKAKFLENCMNCGFNVRYGIEIVDAIINMELTPDSKDMIMKVQMLKQQNEFNAMNNGAMNGGAMAGGMMGAQGQWVCPNCGGTNSGKFCQNCGTPRP